MRWKAREPRADDVETIASLRDELERQMVVTNSALREAQQARALLRNNDTNYTRLLGVGALLPPSLKMGAGIARPATARAEPLWHQSSKSPCQGARGKGTDPAHEDPPPAALTPSRPNTPRAVQSAHSPRRRSIRSARTVSVPRVAMSDRAEHRCTSVACCSSSAAVASRPEGVNMLATTITDRSINSSCLPRHVKAPSSSRSMRSAPSPRVAVDGEVEELLTLQPWRGGATPPPSPPAVLSLPLDPAEHASSNSSPLQLRRTTAGRPVEVSSKQHNSTQHSRALAL